MNSSSSSRYRSYRDKKSQAKRLQSYFLRILVLFLSYSLITSFFIISVRINGDSMSPSLKDSDALIVIPANKITTVAKNRGDSLYRRGEIVLSGTNYQVNPKGWEKVVDPIVRVLTLQKKSLIYNNSNYMGRAEFYRIVGIPGDTVKVKDYTVYVKPQGDEFFLSEFELTEVNYDSHKKELPEKWKDEYPFSSEFDEIVIGKDQYFLISDNRSVLNDSRVYGAVDSSSIKGRAVLKYWPINEFKSF